MKKADEDSQKPPMKGGGSFDTYLTEDEIASSNVKTARAYKFMTSRLPSDRPPEEAKFLSRHEANAMRKQQVSYSMAMSLSFDIFFHA